MKTSKDDEARNLGREIDMLVDLGLAYADRQFEATHRGDQFEREFWRLMLLDIPPRLRACSTSLRILVENAIPL